MKYKEITLVMDGDGYWVSFTGNAWDSRTYFNVTRASAKRVGRVMSRIARSDYKGKVQHQVRAYYHEEEDQDVLATDITIWE